MRESRHLLLLAVIAIALSGVFAVRRAETRPSPGAAVAGARFRLDEAAADRAGAPVLPVAARRAPFAFAPGTADADRQAFLAAAAGARPPARRLVGLVDGLVDVRIGPTGQAGGLGLTVSGGARLPRAGGPRQARP